MNASVPEPRSARACLERTQSAVLNVLVASAAGIAASGLLLRWRDGWALFRRPDLQRPLLVALLAVALISYATRRVLVHRLAACDPAARPARFFWAHVIAAVIAAMAVPLGLIYGWLARPRLDAVAPFWIVALALGFLALPRAHDVDSLNTFEPAHPSALPTEPRS